MKYYLKKCGFQELGSVGLDGKRHRGRYLLTSKNEEVLEFFPPLSIAQKNDSALLPVIPLYSGEKVYCNFVYHNDKYHGSIKNPRDEYRLYLNKSLEAKKLLYKPGDVLIFRKEEISNESDEKQIVYYLDLLNDKNSMVYKACNEIIEKSEIHGGYAIYDGIISECEEKIEKLEEVGSTKISIDASVTKRVLQTEEKDSAMAGLFNPSTFRDFVMVGYGNLCAVTRTVISYKTYTNLEAAHIKPKAHGGLFIPSNGLALTRDFHWAFDKGFFTIDDDFRVKVHDKATSEYLHSFSKKEIYIPKDKFFAPNHDNLQYHQENVYGLFLTTGRL